VLLAGETLVDMIPERPGALADVETFHRRAGGAPANVAVALARLGPAPRFWTRLGADALGDFLAETLAAEGIPDRFVERDGTARTTLAFVAHDGARDRAFTFYRDDTADTRLEPGRVPDGALGAIGWVVVGGVCLAASPARDAIRGLVERAVEADATVVLDPNARPELFAASRYDYPTEIGAMLERTDVVVASPEDLTAAAVGGETDGPAALARGVHDRGPHTAVVTLGADGAYASATEAAPWGPGEVRHDGFAVEPVDATGAGDAFTAGVVRALADGGGLGEALAFAGAVAAVATTDAGAMTALPTREAVEAFRASHGSDDGGGNHRGWD
jgi:fructokinase